MGIIANEYLKKFVCRYNKDVGVPYFCYLDFEGLHQEASSFINSNNVEIRYFYYYYDNYQTDKIVLFLHGIGPGHTAYLREIEYLAKEGFKVLTLDYQGCGESKGDNLRSLNEPTKDVNDLLDYLKMDTEIVVIGHSLGAYTALNILSLRDEIIKGVVIAPFISIKSLVFHFTKSHFITSHILNYEMKAEPSYFDINLLSFLKETSKNILFIHSIDDPVVPYENATKEVKELDNSNFEFIIENNKGHNPNYQKTALDYMNEVFDKYNVLLKKKIINTNEDKINYFKDVSLHKLTLQDEKIMKKIIDYIK